MAHADNEEGSQVPVRWFYAVAFIAVRKRLVWGNTRPSQAPRFTASRAAKSTNSFIDERDAEPAKR